MFARALTAIAAIAALMVPAAPAVAVTPGPSCGELLEKGDNGVAIRVLFAKNGAVQRYNVVGPGNPESLNDLRVALEHVYGPEGVNAPPVQIVSFKHANSGGMMVPDKAIDSCGRKSSFL